MGRLKSLIHKGLELRYSLRPDDQRVIIINDKVVGVEKKLIDKLVFNSLMHSLIVHTTGINRHYQEVNTDAENIYN